MQLREIPLSATCQQFTVSLSGRVWQMRLIWRDAAGWVLDMLNASGDPVITGIPLIPGTDLLAQYGWLNPGGRLVVVTEDEQPPGETSPGQTAKFYWLTD